MYLSFFDLLSVTQIFSFTLFLTEPHLLCGSSIQTLYNNRRPAIKYMAPTNEDALQDTDDEAVQE